MRVTASDSRCELIFSPAPCAGAIDAKAVTGSCTVIAQVVENRLLSFGTSRPLLWTKSFGAASNLLFACLLIRVSA